MDFSITIHTDLTADSFWQAVHILLTKFHTANKRLWGSKIWFKYNCKADCSSWKIPTTLSCLDDYITNENIEKLVRNIFNELKIHHSEKTKDAHDMFEVIMIEHLPKTYTDKQAYQLVCLQRNKLSATFYNVTPVNWKQNLCPDFVYTIHLNQNNVVLSTLKDESSKSYQWLANTLLPQFVRWGTDSDHNKMKSKICLESLALISKVKYYEKYNYLKLKYGKEMVKIWPECTDASKFVYEDVAIATYLLLLWEQDTSKKTMKFVDLGCGNGLLVFILAKEGHSGVGLDVRKRNIWDMYPTDVVLQEKTITPSDVSIFPDVDWIIGNHSDELTPWIPVITAKSSFKCNFFLLPCCAYNFDGSKYQRKNSDRSQYVDYLEYITELCKDCGFKVDRDRLKIPSTKRICLVTCGRMYTEDEYQQYCHKIDDIIYCGSNVIPGAQSYFKAREQVERVRNCTQIDKNVASSIVHRISNYLLEGCSKTDPTWSPGKTAEIYELIHLISKAHLSVLKSECGGLQTLLKNNHNIFKVESGKVQLRYPRTIKEINADNKRTPNQNSLKIKQKSCWFYSNHPQGCPLKDADCSFLHVNS